MSLHPYPEYKESGIKWLAHVPLHWRITRLKNSISEAKNGVWGLEPDGSELDLRCVRVADFDRPRLSIHDRNSTLRKVPFNEQKGRILEKGDLLLEKSGGGEKSPVGFVVLYDRDEPAVCSNFVARLVLSPGMDSRFWTYLHSMLYSLRLTQRSIKQTTGIQNLDQASYFNELVPFPTDDDQRVIADFLDRETAEIDAFIADQERLIELLEERRAATITHAVTKGLDPTVPMKDSGIEGLGDIPGHWVSGPVKRFFVSLDSRRIPLSSEERSYRQGPFPYYGASGIIDMVDDFLFDEPLVLVSEDGANLNLRSTPIAFVATGKYWVNNHAHILRPRNEAVYFWAERLEALDVSPWTTGAAQPKLTAEALMNLEIAVPSSFAECLDIQEHVLQETSEIDAAVSDAEEAIALSRERRAALISAAVTGQIDVSQAQSRGSVVEMLEQGVQV